MQLTAEQEAVIQTSEDLVINAVAGSGKTTTLVAYAQSRPAGSRMLYLAFNKTVKAEAIRKFSQAGIVQVTVETAHSLAYDHIVKYSHYQVAQEYKSHQWCDLLGIRAADPQTAFILANHVNKFIAYFCNSSATRVQDLNYAEVVTDVKAAGFVKKHYAAIERYTRKALAQMDKATIPITHDFYLKKFQLSKPVLPYDYILFDEGQDASVAMLDVFLQQKAVKVIVGDIHQQIYGWRYAINSLQQVSFPVHYLSNSFRFGDEIALIANKILNWKQHLQQPPAIKITGAASPVNSEIRCTRATLGRTNLRLLLSAIAQWQQGDLRSVHFEGNINSYTFGDEGASLYDVLNLYNGKTDRIKDPVIAGMKTITELEVYIEQTEDNSLSVMLDVVKEFGNELPTLIKELKTHHTDNKEEADMIFSTVHRCKGMEYDEVTLLSDFMSEEKLLRYIKQLGGENIKEGERNRLIEEINILYVAATRARQKLILPPGINPLQNISIAEPAVVVKKSTTRYNRNSDDAWSLSDWSDTAPSASYKGRQPGNRYKRWSKDEESLLQDLYSDGQNIKDIARQLDRGQSAIRYKLIQIGLLEEGM